MSCAQILVILLNLNNRKFYIPGETSEKQKLRMRAMDLGILVILANAFISLKCEELTQFLQEEFLDRLEETDIEYHFGRNHSHYEIVSEVVKVEARQHIDD